MEASARNRAARSPPKRGAGPLRCADNNDRGSDMTKTTKSPVGPSDRHKRLVGRLLESRWLGQVARLPPLTWAIRTLTGTLVRRRIGTRPPSAPGAGRAVAAGLEATLQAIAYDVVNALGYVGAMVATYEQGDALPVRAFYIDPRIASMEQIRQWEQAVSAYTPPDQPLSITNPDIARVFVFQDQYQNNLSVQAFRSGGPVISDDLFTLFTPIAPAAAQPIIRGVQDALGIEQVIAVPFFLEVHEDGQPSREFVGNLFAAKSARISVSYTHLTLPTIYSV